VVAGGLVLIAAGAGLMWLLRPPAPRPSLVRVSLDVLPAEELRAGLAATSPWAPTPGGSRTAFAWTPDGRSLVFVGRRGGVQQLYVRALRDADARPLPATENAQVPAVSADGSSVAFWADDAIKSVPIRGGSAVTLANLPRMPPKGMAWGANGRLLYASWRDGALWQLAGGAPKAVTTTSPGELHMLPHWLPGGTVATWTVRRRFRTWGGEQIVAQDLVTGARTVLVEDAADARYVPTGHLVFLRRGVLMAVPFDLPRLLVIGPAEPLFEGVAQALAGINGHDLTGAGQFDVSTMGTLAYISAPKARPPGARVVSLDRHGVVTPLSLPVRAYGPALSLSRDGRLAVYIRTLTDQSIFVHDLSRPGSLTRLTSAGEAEVPLWTPDGQRVAFLWRPEGGAPQLVWQRADGTGPAETLVSREARANSWFPGGRSLAVSMVRDASAGGCDVAVLDVASEARPGPLLQAPGGSGSAAFSPDGRWVAYTSNFTGRHEVYVQPYPGPGRATMVSVDGGMGPAWNQNGRELFFVSSADQSGRQHIMAADAKSGSVAPSGVPRPLFRVDLGTVFLAQDDFRGYDVAPDGQRFYMVEYLPMLDTPRTHINLIENWFEELKTKVPGGVAK
jgi:serine/threonine-protein kinase